jgi:glycerol-3-phosphate dehydrogenase
MQRRLLIGVGLGVSSLGVLAWLTSPETCKNEAFEVQMSTKIPSRVQHLNTMRASSRANPFDLLIIGGGATGAGCALDASSRGIKTCLIEKEDFGSGTSSKCTKLVHGGVRYLEKAVFQMDSSQLKLVYEALHERLAFLRNAPHLASPIPILTPCYHWWELPYYWAGLKAYDFVAGFSNLIPSRLVNQLESLSLLPTLASVSPFNNKTLKGSVLYYDGSFDDTRMNIALACSASALGACVSNHTECRSLIKDITGKVIGARCKDLISGKEFDVYAQVVVNATGPWADGIRKQSDASSSTSVQGSTGSHIVLPSFYNGNSPIGMIIPKTRDGRVVFMLPWQGRLIAGTTDNKCVIVPKPQATEEEVKFILEALGDYLGVQVDRSHVLSVWSGIRPLPEAPIKEGSSDTQNIVRDHLIFTDGDGMITVTGGKWTTYRRMAEETVDIVARSLGKKLSPCQTRSLPLIGAGKYHQPQGAEVSDSWFDPLSVPFPNSLLLICAAGQDAGVWVSY